MSDKLTMALKATDKKVEDISKSRLGNTYKNIIKLPDYFTAPTQELISLTDNVSCTLVNINDPTHFYYSVMHDELAEYQTGTGTFTTNDLTKVMTENNGSMAFAELYVVDVAAGAIGSYVTLRHTKTTNTSLYGYKDTVIKRISSDITQYRNVYDVPRDIKIVDAQTVDITFIPDTVGTYLVGIYLSLYDCNHRMLDKMTYSPLWGSCRALLPMNYAKHATTAYDGNYDYGTAYMTKGRMVMDNGNVYWDDAAGMYQHTSQKDIAFISHPGITGGVFEYMSQYIVMRDSSDLFFPLKGSLQPDTTYGKVKIMVQYDIVNTGPIKWRLAFSDGTDGILRTLSGITYTETCTKDPIGLVVTGVTEADRKKIQVLFYADNATESGQYRGQNWYSATDTGNFVGNTFIVNYTNDEWSSEGSVRKGELYFFGQDVKPKVYSMTLGSKTEVTSNITVLRRQSFSDGPPMCILRLPSNGVYMIDWSDQTSHFRLMWHQQCIHSDVPTAPVIMSGSYIPSANGYYKGTYFTLYFSPFGYLYDDRQGFYPKLTGTFYGCPQIKLVGLDTDSIATITYYNRGIVSKQVNVPANTTVTGLQYGVIDKLEDGGVSISSTAPILAFTELSASRHTYAMWKYEDSQSIRAGDLSIYPDGANVMVRRLFSPEVDHAVAPIYATARINSNYVMDNYSTASKGWSKTFPVTDYFSGTASLSWNEFTISGASNISCYVSYSTDNITWTEEQSTANGSFLPATGLTMDTRYIKTRFDMPSNNWLYNIKFAYYTWQEL